ncbi:hypothetical protein DERF_014907 [Dermatophagoides farinae]|uniref:Uncharacterized protein n=1 Tax=Dermatophagoides farinae TaxID=6954 RepID=A0A922KVA9_DERFA|nr:hypothetical protein DERF_014907 [Dermatophagoides farinae]
MFWQNQSELVFPTFDALTYACDVELSFRIIEEGNVLKHLRPHSKLNHPSEQPYPRRYLLNKKKTINSYTKNH